MTVAASAVIEFVCEHLTGKTFHINLTSVVLWSDRDLRPSVGCGERFMEKQRRVTPIVGGDDRMAHRYRDWMPPNPLFAFIPDDERIREDVAVFEVFRRHSENGC